MLVIQHHQVSLLFPFPYCLLSDFQVVKDEGGVGHPTPPRVGQYPGVRVQIWVCLIRASSI